MMHGLKQSDPAIVPLKAANKGTSVPAEPTEGRAGIKGNPRSQSTHRTQGRARVSQAAERIRQAATRNPKEKLTALMHHITTEALAIMPATSVNIAASSLSLMTPSRQRPATIPPIHSAILGHGFNPSARDRSIRFQMARPIATRPPRRISRRSQPVPDIDRPLPTVAESSPCSHQARARTATRPTAAMIRRRRRLAPGSTTLRSLSPRKFRAPVKNNATTPSPKWVRWRSGSNTGFSSSNI